MSSKIIIIATVILLIASFATLFVIEARNHDYDYNKNWSVVYFENPCDLPETTVSLQAGDSLDFAIENHEGRDAKYNYNVFVDDNKLIDSEVEIKAGATQKISPVIPVEKLMGSKVLISVKYKDMEYKIYKNLKK